MLEALPFLCRLVGWTTFPAPPPRRRFHRCPSAADHCCSQLDRSSEELGTTSKSKVTRAPRGDPVEGGSHTADDHKVNVMVVKLTQNVEKVAGHGIVVA